MTGQTVGAVVSPDGVAMLARVMGAARSIGPRECRAKAVRCEARSDARGARLWRAAAELVEWEGGS